MAGPPYGGVITGSVPAMAPLLQTCLHREPDSPERDLGCLNRIFQILTERSLWHDGLAQGLTKCKEGSRAALAQRGMLLQLQPAPARVWRAPAQRDTATAPAP